MKLAVVMPVYNEEEVIERVLREWMKELDSRSVDYSLFVMNDGSNDETLNILNRLSRDFSKLKVISKPNSGHGQTCVSGYTLAIEKGYDWIFQIDSDGQCDPKFLQHFLSASQNNKLIYGYRKTRDEGLKRLLISRIVSVFAFAATWTWVRDANVPYRLMHRDTLQEVLPLIPPDFHLANVFLSVLHQQRHPIHWIDIHFRKRMGGTASVKTFSFVRNGFKLFRQLRMASRATE